MTDRRPTLPLLAALAWPCALPAVEDLCIAGEKAVFACDTGAGLASVCATPDFSATAGSIRILYGTQRAIELAWPDGPARRGQITKGTLLYAGKLGSYLRFRQERGSFVVFSVPGRDSGIVIERDRSIREKRLCRQAEAAGLADLPVPVAEAIAVSGVGGVGGR
jgi:hypothetical protein